MKKALELFDLILDDTKNINSLYSYLNNVVKPPYDYSDLLRWQWAQSISALDKLVHDLVKIGMMEIFNEKRNPTKKFNTFQLNFDMYKEIQKNPNSANQLFEQQILMKHNFLSFQDPDKISEALSNIWDESHKWHIISQKLSLEESFVRTKLKNISIRRNQIVHEGDYSNILFKRQPLTEEDINDVVDFIKKIGHSIFESVCL